MAEGRGHRAEGKPLVKIGRVNWPRLRVLRGASYFLRAKMNQKENRLPPGVKLTFC